MLPKRIKATQTFKRTQAFVKRYERFLMPAMLLGGTALDAVQFRTLSTATTFLISGVYVVICATAMLLMVAELRSDRRALRYLQVAAPFIQQFTIGALLSTALLFYWFSGSLVASWPVMGLLAFLMVSNEALRRHVTKPSVQIGVFYFALFALSAVLFAYLVNSLHPVVFIVGGIASVAVMMAYLVLFVRTGRLQAKRRQMWFTVAGIFAFMNIAYFLNFIPPIPLSLREAGIYASVTRSGNDYVLLDGDENWFERLIPGQRLTIDEGQRLYAFTSISAPADLSTTIVHRWEYFDPSTRGWETASRLSFGMTGGREDGYRGYSYKTNIQEGKWRVTVETERGQVLGRLPFTVRYNE